jgi:hypothetical protein
MVDELNDIVFSKTFKAPSAWADRERKYKMEARDWGVEVRPARSAHFQPALDHQQVASCRTVVEVIPCLCQAMHHLSCR